MPEVLYDEVVEVEERVVLHQEACQLLLPGPLIQGNTGEKVWHIHCLRRVHICKGFNIPGFHG